MRLAISNIAWNKDEDYAVSELLRSFNVNAIDVAPGKYFPDIRTAKDKEITNVKQWWADRGIEITGMQALLFGTVGLNMFGDEHSCDDMLQHLRAVCRIGAGLGASRLVFGSPKNRDRSGLSNDEVLKKAVTFFRRLGRVAEDYGVIVCLEPNPSRYGANFMTGSEETARIVSVVDHTAIRMQFDTGSLTINGESPDEVLKANARYIGHIHISEPDLLPLGDGGTDHASMSTALRKYLPNHVASVEILATDEEPHLVSIERSLALAAQYYKSINMPGVASTSRA